MNPTYDELSQKIGWGSYAAQTDPEKIKLLDMYTAGELILDVGCATGVYATYLSAKGKQVFGLDMNLRLLQLAKQRSHFVNWIKGDILTVDFQPKSFDTVVAFDVLEHLDEDVALEKMIQLAKKRVILTVPCETDPVLKELFLLYGHHQDPTHLRTYTETSVQQLLKKHNLIPLEIKPSHPLSTDELFITLTHGPKIIRRFIRKLAFTLTKPRRFYTNISIAAEIK